MTVKPRAPRGLSAKKAKAQVLRLIPPITKPLSANCYEVVSKLKKTLITAQSGSTVGALVVTVDKGGYWSTDLAGQLMYDREILCQIAFRLLGVCMTAE
jgi:predicted esterase YcpF (UPF0227 family)